MNFEDYLRDGLPEEHRVVYMRPQGAPPPTDSEKELFRILEGDLRVIRAKSLVEAAQTPDGRRELLADLNRVIREVVDELSTFDHADTMAVACLNPPGE